ncbi:MAG: DUF2442 domain-containing protein [Chloroflexota bacterium]
MLEAKPLRNYRLWLRFSDGLTGEVDLSHLAGKGVFERWTVPGEFEKVTIDPAAGTVVWPGGLDVAPDALYERVAGKVPASS